MSPPPASPPAGRSPAERRTRWLLFFYAIALFMATHWPHPPQVDDLPGIDKLEHLLAYAGLGWLLSRYFFFRWRHPLRVLALTLAVVGPFACLDELLQIPVGRQCDWRDGVADMAGAALGWAAFAMIGAVRRRSKHAAPAET